MTAAKEIKMKKGMYCAAGLLLAVLSTTSYAAPPQYTVTVLPRPSASFSTLCVNGINNLGQVVGESYDQADTMWHALLWDRGQVTDLSSVSPYASQACDINNRSQVISGAGYIWQYGQWTLIDLQTQTYIVGTSGMDDCGRIIGRADSWADGHLAISPFLWDQTAGFRSLGNLGGLDGEASAISDTAGYVVGSVYDVDWNSHAFVWKDEVLTDLDPEAIGSSALDVNDHGWVVGWISPDDVTLKATLWRDTEKVYLDACEFDSVALGINNADQVVGCASGYTSHGPYSTQYAFLWQDGVMYDLNNYIDAGSGWVLRIGSAINDRGQIAGFGNDGDGYWQAILLTPVPEPSSVLALAGGLVVLGGVIRRGRAKCTNVYPAKIPENSPC